MEYYYISNTTYKSPKDSRDYLIKNYHKMMKNRDMIPLEYDLRPFLQPIRNQGRQGSCAAQTAACIKEYHEKKDIEIDQYFSPQFIYNLRENQDSEGMYGRNVMQIIKNYGVCPETYYEYGKIEKNNDMINKNKEVFNVAKNFCIATYMRIEKIDDLKRCLYENGPCYISFPTYNYSSEFWKPQHKDQVKTGGHAVTVVGYTNDGFILRNSWGKEWGDNGYTIYKYDDFKKNIHWEIWGTVDAPSEIIENLKKKSNKNLCNCFSFFNK